MLVVFDDTAAFPVNTLFVPRSHTQGCYDFIYCGLVEIVSAKQDIECSSHASAASAAVTTVNDESSSSLPSDSNKPTIEDALPKANNKQYDKVVYFVQTILAANLQDNHYKYMAETAIIFRNRCGPVKLAFIDILSVVNVNSFDIFNGLRTDGDIVRAIDGGFHPIHNVTAYLLVTDSNRSVRVIKKGSQKYKINSALQRQIIHSPNTPRKSILPYILLIIVSTALNVTYFLTFL